MTEDWFDEGRRIILNDLAEEIAEADAPDDAAYAVYSYLVSIGLIDYDVEKDVLYEVYHDDEDDEYPVQDTN